MLGDHIDVLVAVVRRRDFVATIGAVTVGFFFAVVAFIREPGFLADSRQRRVAAHGRQPGEGLQMALADRRGVVAALGQQVDEGVGGQRQAAAVVAQPVQARVAPGQQRRAIGHAHRRGGVEPIKPGPLPRDGIDVGGLQDRMPSAAEPVGPLLIGDQVEKVGLLGHGGPRVASGRQAFMPNEKTAGQPIVAQADRA